MSMQRRIRGTLLPVGSVVCLSLAGCADDKLYLSSTTVLGLNASVNTARNAGSVQFGYDRYFIIWVPQSVDEADGSSEVMSALNCTEVTVGFLSLKKFQESLATGNAARIFAKKVGTNDFSYFECFRQTPAAGSQTVVQ